MVFQKPIAVAEINVIVSDDEVATMSYTTMDAFYSALVRANLGNARGTFKKLQTVENDNGKVVAWITIESKKDDALQE